MQPLDPEERVRYWDLQSKWIQLWAINRRCFELDLALDRLERRSPGKSPQEQHEVRMKRIELRHELEMIKINLADLKHQAAPYLKTETV